MKSKAHFWFFMALTSLAMFATILAGLAKDEYGVTNAVAMTTSADADLSVMATTSTSKKSNECVLDCALAKDQERCSSRMGLMMICENSTCIQSRCAVDADCFTFASAYGMYDSCRTYSCLHGQCIDQFAVAIPNPPVPGDICTSNSVASGMCSQHGNCEEFACKQDADCPPYALECAVIRCDIGDGMCKPMPLRNGTPCSNGMCSNGTCN